MSALKCWIMSSGQGPSTASSWGPVETAQKDELDTQAPGLGDRGQVVSDDARIEVRVDVAQHCTTVVPEPRKTVSWGSIMAAAARAMPSFSAAWVIVPSS